MAVTTKGQVDDYKSISSKEIKDVIESLLTKEYKNEI